MSSGWQEAAAQQAEEVSSRLRQLLITGLGFLRSEMGLELGLEPQRYPAWVFLAVPVSLGLCLLLLLLHCATSRGAPSSKRPAQQEQPVLQPRAPLPSKAQLRVEEPKKKSRKKPADKAKPNGRPVELSEEVLIPAGKKESPKQGLDADKKNEKIKKNKKKPKADTKPLHPSASQDKKEAEEGNWETKISNKEKRQQRKRDKGADTDTGPETEAFTVVSTQTVNIRKAKGPSEASAVNGSSWNEKPTKVIPAQLVEEKWVTPSNAAGKKKAESCTWNQENVDANGKDWSAAWSERSIFPGMATWPNVDARLNSSEKRPPFSNMGLNNAVSAGVNDFGPQTNVAEKQWEVPPAEPSADDEWSGLNPSSDWNAPAEEWGNYGEEEPAPSPQTEEPEQELPKVSDDDKEKDEQSGPTSAGSKTKKKKKKKKKQGEESGSPTQEGESTRDAGENYKEDSVPTPVIPTVVTKNELKEKHGVQEKRLHTVALNEAPASAIHKVEKISSQAQEPNASVTKQNSAPPPSQAKSEESWESPKQVKKKKKARRET